MVTAVITVELTTAEAKAILEIIDGASPADYPVATLGGIYAKILTGANA